MDHAPNTSWSRWCELFDAAEQDIYEAHHFRQVWRTINAIIDQSGVDKDAGLMTYLTKTYVAYVASFVRRESDMRRDTANLTRCFSYLESSPDAITRTQYRSMAASTHDTALASDGGFDAFALPGAETLDSVKLRRARESLAAAAKTVKRYVDDQIAHRSASGTATSLTLRDVDQAMGEIEQAAKGLFALRNPGVILWTVTPASDPKFLRMFQKAWFPPGSMLPRSLGDEV